jgi:phosphate transport system protein
MMIIKQLTDLKNKLLEHAVLVQHMVDKSIKGIEDKNSDLFWEVIKKDEPRVNSYDIEIDEMCTAIIAQFEPMARDLRIVLMILKMNHDLERMGDHAVNISESGLFLVSRPTLKATEDLPLMGQAAANMLKDRPKRWWNAILSSIKWAKRYWMS